MRDEPPPVCVVLAVAYCVAAALAFRGAARCPSGPGAAFRFGAGAAASAASAYAAWSLLRAVRAESYDDE